MKTITIVLLDLPKGKGCAVMTDAAPPAIGQPVTPAEALAMDLLRLCNQRANSVQYGQQTATLAGDLMQAIQLPELQQ